MVTEASIVYLMGIVTQAEADGAVQIARTTGGVLKVGDKVSKGSLVALLEGQAGSVHGPSALAAPATAPASAAVSVPASAPPVSGSAIAATVAAAPHDPTAPKAALPHASPSVRRFARELGVPVMNEAEFLDVLQSHRRA